eukprot:CAMPEP_0198458502 /NCGR_PEP_ID=MMETSP1453-20131121/35907_1 /TAXON_ID=1461543 ORGANISM="Unidentified sp., Strain RCC701" /NCGR_SAMPLE_ID=MMETSP1453 /ASSEMBLY_ACC=CAM_ASM_001118 /LENGTH=86 /DNA_ID=CAMNT_0044183361 /DNA_START=6 /DNA_END=262 /DNA_ORIENTATION=+
MRALTSGTMEGLAWSLNTLAIVAYDARSEICLPKLPGLLDALVTVINSCLVEYPIVRKKATEDGEGKPEREPARPPGAASATMAPG